MSEDSYPSEKWNNFQNSLQFYEKIEELHQFYQKYNEKENINKNGTTGDSFLFTEMNNKIKPSMYNYDVRNYYKDSEILKKKILELSNEIMNAINHIYNMFRICKDGVFLCFNGGKDAVVTLHLFRCAYAKYIKDIKGKIIKPKLIYFKEGSTEFPEMGQFLNQSVFMFDFDLYIVDGNWKESVTGFIQNFYTRYTREMKENYDEHNPNRNAYLPTISFIMGTRMNDPCSENLEILNISSKNLPPYLYLNPIFYWSYGAVWTFILYFKLDYCILYNYGYTSIGSTSDTIRNEYLKWNNCYLPAYFLKDWKHERFNRVVRKRV